MASREALHRLIEELPERDMPAVTRFLQGLHATTDPLLTALDAAPLDDEPDDDDFDGGLTEARVDAEAGRGITIAIEALIQGAGLGKTPLRQRDLSDIAGTWQEDPEFDQAIADQDRMDEQRQS